MSLLNKVTIALIILAVLGIIAVIIRNKVIPAEDHEGVDPRPQPNKPFIDWMKSYSLSEEGYAFFNVIFTKNGTNTNIPGIIVCKKGIFIISTKIKSDIEKVQTRRNDVLFYINNKGKIKKSYDFIKDANFMSKQVKLITKCLSVDTILPTRGKPIIFNDNVRSMNMYDIKTYINELPNIYTSLQVERLSKDIESQNRFDLVKNKRRFGFLPEKLWR